MELLGEHLLDLKPDTVSLKATITAPITSKTLFGTISLRMAAESFDASSS
jgi:hypothetical protein